MLEVRTQRKIIICRREAINGSEFGAASARVRTYDRPHPRKNGHLEPEMYLFLPSSHAPTKLPRGRAPQAAPSPLAATTLLR